MTTYRRGDVVLVPFPFTDLTTTKRRPALVISANWYNTERKDCILLPITSTRHSELGWDEVLLKGTDARSAGLLYDSVVKAGVVFTIHQYRIVKTMGRLAAARVKEAFERLIEALSA